MDRAPDDSPAEEPEASEPRARLVVGLGNPGPQYEANRHNVGFMVLERLAEELGAPGWREGLGGRWVEVRAPEAGGRDVLLLEPWTYMNRSGLSVAAAREATGAALDEVLVVHDDLDLELGRLKLKRSGGTGGHNGLKSIVAKAGGPGFDRLRVGIGRPAEGTIVDWVLGDFTQSEGARLGDVLDDATRALRAVLAEGSLRAMDRVNARRPVTDQPPSSLPDDAPGATDREES